MIINKEQIETIDDKGNPALVLLISYINKDGQVSFLKWPIPESERFEWAYTSRAYADKPFSVTDPETGEQHQAQWMSYDNKFVKKVPTSKPLSDYRINEILNMFGKQVDPIFEAHTPDMWYCDIETAVSDEGFPDRDLADLPITTISITKFPQTICFAYKPLSETEISNIQHKLDTYSDLIKDYKFDYREFRTEKEMLSAFIDFIIPLPAISGWNFLGFDWLYICNRCKNLGIDYKKVSPTRSFTNFKLARKVTLNVSVPMHKIIADNMTIYQQWDKTIQPHAIDTLDWVSETVLGTKKVEHEWGFNEFYTAHFTDYVFYNLIDTILVELIDKKMRTSQVWYMLASELRIDLNTAYSTIKPTETVMQNFIYPQHKVLVRKFGEVDAGGKSYEGAFVWPTQPGIYKYVGGLDFSSLYPTTIRQFLISPETFMFKDQSYTPKEDEIKCKSGAVYKKTSDSLLPSILTHYFALRKQAKNDRKTADQAHEDLMKIYEERLKAEKS